MTERQYPFFDLIRSLMSWILVGLVTIVFFPPTFFTILALLPFDRNRKNIHPLISLWAKTILVVCPLMRIHLEGTHHLEQGRTYVLVANHQSVADIIAVLHLKHPFKFIAKKDLFWIPFMGWALSLAGYIPLVRGTQRSGQEAVKKARDYLKRGVSVLLFPEGTRSRDGKIHEFKAGAFKLATETGVPVVPVVIHGTRNLIPKGSVVIGRRVEVIVQVGEPRFSSRKGTSSIESFCDEVRSEMIHSLDEVHSV